MNSPGICSVTYSSLLFAEAPDGFFVSSKYCRMG